jgi:hypothetical protein
MMNKEKTLSTKLRIWIVEGLRELLSYSLGAALVLFSLGLFLLFIKHAVYMALGIKE